MMGSNLWSSSCLSLLSLWDYIGVRHHITLLICELLFSFPSDFQICGRQVYLVYTENFSYVVLATPPSLSRSLHFQDQLKLLSCEDILIKNCSWAVWLGRAKYKISKFDSEQKIQPTHTGGKGTEALTSNISHTQKSGFKMQLSGNQISLAVAESYLRNTMGRWCGHLVGLKLCNGSKLLDSPWAQGGGREVQGCAADHETKVLPIHISSYPLCNTPGNVQLE